MSDTIFALATPAGRSPQSLVRVSGALVPDIVRELCEAPMLRAAIDFSMSLPIGELPAVAWVLPAPHTLTGQDVLELRLPGNPAVTRQLEERLRELGCRDAEPGEFTRRAFQCGKLDLHKAEAVLQLINATTDAARLQALSDLSGDTASAVSALAERLRALSARFEMSFDFSEEEHAAADEDALKEDLQTLVTDLQAIIGAYELAPRRDCPSIVLFGPPNSGKSTLFNALVGQPRALVSELPGTTRDPVESDIRLGQHSARLQDLSGVGASDLDRGRFTETSRERALQADVLLLLDAPGQNELAAEFDALERRDGSVRSRALWVYAMSDLPRNQLANSAGIEGVSVSGLSGAGIDDLRNRIRQRLDHLATGGATSLLRIRSRDACKLLTQAVVDGTPPEVLASDVRRALTLMDEALLATAPGDVLDLIFSRFCIGK